MAHTSSTQNVYSKQYGSHLKMSHVLFIITNYLELTPKPSWCPQGHHNVHTGL